MNAEFKAKLDRKLAGLRDWMEAYSFANCRIVQYCGVECLGSMDIKRDEIECRVECYIKEGFNADWNMLDSVAVLRIYEYPGPEPAWDLVLSESDLDR
jgi:hypothetical protein